MKPTAESHLGPVIRARRVARGMTLARLASDAEIDCSHLSKIERGLTITTPDGFERIASALGCSFATLWRDAERAVKAA